MRENDQSGGVTIGNVYGDIEGSIIAGRDVSDVVINLGGQPTLADKEDVTADNLRELLAQIQQELDALSAQQEELKAVSALGPRKVIQAQEYINEVAQAVEAETPEKNESLMEYLEEAASSLDGILKNARKKVEEAGEVVQPIIDKLSPLVKKVIVAGKWAAKLGLIVL